MTGSTAPAAVESVLTRQFRRSIKPNKPGQQNLQGIWSEVMGFVATKHSALDSPSSPQPPAPSQTETKRPNEMRSPRSVRSSRYHSRVYRKDINRADLEERKALGKVTFRGKITKDLDKYDPIVNPKAYQSPVKAYRQRVEDKQKLFEAQQNCPACQQLKRQRSRAKRGLPREHRAYVRHTCHPAHTSYKSSAINSNSNTHSRRSQSARHGHGQDSPSRSSPLHVNRQASRLGKRM